MSAVLDIHLPEEIAEYAPELRFFFDNMVRKLHINRHKGFAEGDDAFKFFELLRGEVDELDSALANDSQFEVFMEGVDVANMAWIVALSVLRLNKHDFEQMKKENK